MTRSNTRPHTPRSLTRAATLAAILASLALSPPAWAAKKKKDEPFPETPARTFTFPAADANGERIGVDHAESAICDALVHASKMEAFQSNTVRELIQTGSGPKYQDNTKVRGVRCTIKRDAFAIVLEYANGDTNSSRWARARFETHVDANDTNFSITLTPPTTLNLKVERAHLDLFAFMDDTTYLREPPALAADAAQALASAAPSIMRSIPFKGTLDAPFAPEAIAGNFRRAAAEFTAGQERPIRATARLALFDTVPSKLELTFDPYRAGTKLSYSGTLSYMIPADGTYPTKAALEATGLARMRAIANE